MSASIRIRSGCGARLRKAGKEAGWSNYFFFPIFRCFQKGITRRLHAGNTAHSLTQNAGGLHSSSGPVSLSCIAGREGNRSLDPSLTSVFWQTEIGGGGGRGQVRTITINSDGACLRKKPTLVLSLGTLWSLGQMVAHKGSTVMEASILCYKFLRIKVWQFSLQS